MGPLLVVYHSMTGATRQMAAAAAAGARTEPKLEVSLMRAAEAQIADVLSASGYIFATPENLASMAGLMKDFFDRTYYGALDRINGRACAILVSAGSDGRNAVQQLERIVTGWRLKVVAEPLIVCTHAQTSEEILRPKTLPDAYLKQCEAVGATLASGIAMGIF